MVVVNVRDSGLASFKLFLNLIDALQISIKAKLDLILTL